MLLLRTSRGVDPGIPLLRSLGSNAHVWLPGANGTTVASLPSNNYLLSDGSTGYSTVDGVDGLTLDGMGALGAEKVTNGDYSAGTSSWTPNGTVVSINADKLRITSSAGGGFVSAYQTLSGLTPNGTYLITGSAQLVSGTATCAYLRFYDSVPSITPVAGPFAYSTGAFITTSSYFTASSDGQITLNLAIEGPAAAGVIADFGAISVKEYTGTHLTQATTANKPLVRRGVYNQCLWSELLASGFPSTVLATVVGTLLKPTAAAGQHYVSGNVPQTGTPVVTLAVVAKANGYSWMGLTGSNPGLFTSFDLQNGVVGSVAGGVTASILALGSGKYLCTVTNTYASQGQNIFVEPNSTQASWTPDGVSGIDIFQTGVFLGAWTAAQILAEGGIPTTTATAASNPSAGKYWWSFDGSNDSLLSGNLGITDACTIVVAGRVNTMPSVLAMLFGEDANGVQVYVYPDRSIAVGKNTIAEMLRTSAGVIVAGVPFVITVRLSAGRIDIRKNGALSATALSALTFSATTGMRVGCKFDLTYSLDGALGWVVPLPTALSDADCLTVERLVGSQFPGMASF